MPKIIRNGISYGGTATTANQVQYSPTETVADKIDELGDKIDTEINKVMFVDVEATVPQLIQWGGVYGCDLTFDISGLGLTATPMFVSIVKGNTPYNWMINITNYSATSVSVMIHRGTNAGSGTKFAATLMIIQ